MPLSGKAEPVPLVAEAPDGFILLVQSVPRAEGLVGTGGTAATSVQSGTDTALDLWAVLT